MKTAVCTSFARQFLRITRHWKRIPGFLPIPLKAANMRFITIRVFRSFCLWYIRRFSAGGFRKRVTSWITDRYLIYTEISEKMDIWKLISVFRWNNSRWGIYYMLRWLQNWSNLYSQECYNKSGRDESWTEFFYSRMI